MSYGQLFEEFAHASEKPLSIAEKALKMGLTEAQASAVLSSHQGTIVVTAAAGSGKTTLLLKRLTYLMDQGIAAKDILLCAFTRIAATEMSDRLSKAAGKHRAMPAIGTIHSHQLQFLDEQGRPALINDEQCAQYVEKLRELGPDELVQYSDDEILSRISLQREKAEVSNDTWGLLTQAWEELLAENGLMDFAGLILQGVQNTPRRKFKHILVDEAQDLTELQLKWVKHHLAPKGTIFYVGDDLQSIYAFRGGRTDVLAQLGKKSQASFMIEKNWRSDQNILNLANAFMSDSALKMQASRTTPGEVQVLRFEKLSDEIEFALSLKKIYKNFAVLTRTNDLAAVFKWKGLKALTIHQSKGSEFDCVLVSGLDRGIFPNPMAAIEEEERLLYVAITRAKHKLVLTSSPKKISNRNFSQESAFFDRVRELAPPLLHSQDLNRIFSSKN